MDPEPTDLDEMVEYLLRKPKHRVPTLRLERKTILQFIKLIEDHPCLWNRRDINYPDSERMVKAWKKIASTLGYPVLDLKSKWASIQSTHRGYISRQSKQGETSGATQSVNWFAYKAMNFMRQGKEYAPRITIETAFDDSQTTETDIHSDEGAAAKIPEPPVTNRIPQPTSSSSVQAKKPVAPQNPTPSKTSALSPPKLTGGKVIRKPIAIKRIPKSPISSQSLVQNKHTLRSSSAVMTSSKTQETLCTPKTLVPGCDPTASDFVEASTNDKTCDKVEQRMLDIMSQLVVIASNAQHSPHHKKQMMVFAERMETLDEAARHRLLRKMNAALEEEERKLYKL
uniref:MADF domain-containing protein n=1 Tax=Anopheles dirus TaxID=7168 RepID=A0A182NZ94_9DIPT